jgi:hypothetical protein
VASILSQVAAGQTYENVFEAGLPCSEVKKFGSLLPHCFEQSGDGEVGFSDIEREQAVIVADRLDSRQSTPRFLGVTVSVGTHTELDDVMSAQAVDEISG